MGRSFEVAGGYDSRLPFIGRYREIWDAALGNSSVNKNLTTLIIFAVALLKSAIIVGHVPRTLASYPK